MVHSEIPSWAKDVALALLQTVKMKDPFTFYHCCRVGRAARRLGKALSLNEFEQSVLEFAGLFHDIGKVGVEDRILLKPGRLDVDEVEKIKSHPLLSAEIIEPLAAQEVFFKFLLPGIKCHHERVDGAGYPYGLEGENVPLLARVIAVVDTVDAMTNSRPYRNALTMDIARKELVDFSGTQFDKAIVKTYLEAEKHELDISESSDEELIVGHVLKVA